jgi:hypothetical protein
MYLIKIIIIILILLSGCYDQMGEECDPESDDRLKTIIEDEKGDKKCVYCNDSGYWDECKMATVIIQIEEK